MTSVFGPSLSELAELWKSQDSQLVYKTYTGPIGETRTGGPLVEPEPSRTAEIKRHFVSPSLYGNPIAQGWECPKCGHVYAPSVALCLYCGPKQTVTTNTTNDPGTGGKP